MKQPIVLDPEVIFTLLNNRDVLDNGYNFFRLIKILKEHHIIVFDNNSGTSIWLNEFEKIKNSLKNKYESQFLNYINPKHLNFAFYIINSDQKNFLFELAQKTPEKIGIKYESLKKDKIIFYDIKYFNSDNNNDTENFLLRDNKTIELSIGTTISDFRLFSPYVREAQQIEICDKYFMINPNYDDDLNFILSIVKKSKKLNKLIFHINLDEDKQLNDYKKELIFSRASEFFGEKGIELDFYLYNSELNHDRFILIDTNKFSIKFTTSFNNFRKINENTFRVAKACSIIFTTDRKYFDNSH
ncbi:MAG: hypothetical protein NUV92_07545 [Ignavibacteria bacterium]|jgi:hypothetical protein|nr:hypothetical protein [Ignavibacteria bacterium]MDH7528347.1 MIT C-terminal domain-containing protein [Ignavibacteria bacterium]